MLCCLTFIIFGASIHTKAIQSGQRTRKRVLIIQSRNIPFYDKPTQAMQKRLRAARNLGITIDEKVIALKMDPKEDDKLLQEGIQFKPDIILTLGTDATKQVASLKLNVPVVFSLVLDPISLKVADSLETPGQNFTGTTLHISPGKQLEQCKELLPNIKRVGVLYTEKDPTSETYLRAAREEMKQLEIELVAVPVTAKNRIPTAVETQEALKKLESVDVCWTILDPASTAPVPLTETFRYAKNKKIPVVGLNETQVSGGALMALYIDLEEVGVMTGEMALQILNRVSNPAKMPIQQIRKKQLALNSDVAKRLGIMIPPSFKRNVDVLIPEVDETLYPE